MNSCIYEGTIRHRRFWPRSNSFQYRIFMMFLDLAELDTVFGDHPLWSVGKVNIAYLRRRDHFGDPRIFLDQEVRSLVSRKLGTAPQGPIRMLTHLRYWGHCFNPVTFYYCYDVYGRRVETIVAEIHNTPWGEHYCYVLGPAANEHPQQQWRRYRVDKDFHVSPFIDMDIHYDWRFREPGRTLNIHLIDYQKGRKLFDATLVLNRRAITRKSLNRMLIKYPALTVKVISMIYWQALRLVLKKIPFYVHPGKQEYSEKRQVL
ncbi:MAG: DUF1365 domain-containing protein [Desulfobacterales bacterium]